MQLNDEVEYTSIYFVMGEAPKDWGRNAITDPPSGGWSNAFIIRRPGYQPKIFVPYTVQSWSVPPTCYELERTREPLKPVDPVWMKDCIERNFISRQSLGVPMDKEAAGYVIQALGFELPDMFKSEEAEKPAKERKVKPKSAVREARAGLISISVIAEELKLLPRIARGYLRDLKIEKPAHGWAGDQAWADDIKAKLAAAIKGDAEKAKKPKAKKPEELPPVVLNAKKVKERVTKKAKIVVKDTPAQKVMLKAIPKPAAKKKAPAKKAAPKKKGKKA